MKISIVPVLALFIAVTRTEPVTSNKNITSYDPAHLLSKIFNTNITTESRQRGYGFVNFDDQPDLGIDPINSAPGQYEQIDSDRDQRPLRFENDYDQTYDSNLDTIYNDHTENRPLKFEDQNPDSVSNNGSPLSFQDDNNISYQGSKHKRKRRRRRKPKNGVLPYPGPNFVGPQTGNLGYLGPNQGGYGPNSFVNPGYPGSHRRPRRPRPRPSLASDALSSLTQALTSIARYDDYQCVPRLLCEAAGGRGLGDSGILQSIAGLQPLLTLLSAYNGVSTSPLFVFGRAVFLGMTSKGNTGTCRYAYPQCPTDPEQLIHYLNNHNGGFFRFFNAPQPANQNLQEFYNQLGQGYGVYQPDSGQGYGYPQAPNSGQNYGLYPDHNTGYPRPGDGQIGQYGLHRPGLYNNLDYGSNYAYGYNTYGSGNRIRFKDNNRIEKRIQNKPPEHFEDDDDKTRWQFPGDDPDIAYNNDYSIRDIRTLKFPENDQSLNNQNDYRKGKRIHLPENQYNQNHYNNRKPIYTNYNDNRYQTTTYSYNNGLNTQNYYNNRPIIYTNNNYKYPTTTYKYNDDYSNYNNGQNYNNNNNYQSNQNYYNNQQNMYNDNYKYPKSTVFNNEEYVFDYKHNFYIKKDRNDVYNSNKNSFKRSEDDGLKTVYVVRGNGDPNKPEIVKLRPGQSVH